MVTPRDQQEIQRASVIRFEIFYFFFLREIKRHGLGHCRTGNRMVASQLGQLNFTPDNRTHAATSVPNIILNRRQVLKNKLFTGKFLIFWTLRDLAIFSSKG